MRTGTEDHGTSNGDLLALESEQPPPDAPTPSLTRELLLPARLGEESPACTAGRILGVLCGLTILAMALWWRNSLSGRGLDGRGLDVFAAVSGVVIAATSVLRKPYLLMAVLFLSALPFLYLLGGEGPPKWAGYGYLGALVAALLVHIKTRAA